MSIQWHEKIGEGASGSVTRITYKHPRLGYIEAAAKSVTKDFRKSEVDILKKLKHDNIVKLYGYEEIRPCNCIILEYTNIGCLNNYLRDHFPLPHELYVKWAEEAIIGIQYLHENRIIHRDIKPGNCLIFPELVLKLSDFGISKELEHSRSNTQASCLGTPVFMAPEIHQNTEFSYSSDIYAYGMLLLVMFTAQQPFPDKDDYNAVWCVVNDNLRPTIPSDCPPSLEQLIQRCWKRDRRQRPTPRDISKALCIISVAANVVHAWYLNEIIGKEGDEPGDLKWARGIAIGNKDDIIVADWKQYCVSVFDRRGGFKACLSSPKFKYPFDVATTRTGEIAVADQSSYVKWFNEKGDYVRSICTLTVDEEQMTNTPTALISSSIAVDPQGNILVGDIQRGREAVTIQATENDGDRSIKRIALNIRPDFLATNVMKDNQYILISNWEKRKAVAVDYNGDELFTILPKIDGKPGRPYGVTCDRFGFIYIVVRHVMEDSGNHHIHQYQNDGKFLGCIVQDLANPRGITLSKGFMFVANTTSVAIYKRVDVTMEQDTDPDTDETRDEISDLETDRRRRRLTGTTEQIRSASVSSPSRILRRAASKIRSTRSYSL